VFNPTAFTDLIVGAPGTVALAAPADAPLTAAPMMAAPHNQVFASASRDRELGVRIVFSLPKKLDSVSDEASHGAVSLRPTRLTAPSKIRFDERSGNR
jgi:hypothetical protein